MKDSQSTIHTMASEISREMDIPFPKTIKVLIIEDSDADAFLAKHALEKSNHISYVVDVANNVDPLDAIMEGKHDAYIIDVRMGQHDGFKLIESAFNTGHRGPFVIFTGSMVENADDIALKTGAMDYLEKNEVVSNPSVLDRKIRAVIRNFRVMESLRRRLKVAEDALNTLNTTVYGTPKK